MRYNARMRTRWLPVITGLFVAVLLISNIASVKFVNVWLFTFDGGTLLFPLSYIFGDILTEVYGYGASRKVIWTGFVSAALMMGMLWLVGRIPGPTEAWTAERQDAYTSILLWGSRIVIASLIAYFAGEFSNSYVLAKLKIATKGRFLWVRTIGSTIVGEGVDTLLFCLIAFYDPANPNNILMAIIVSNYVFKCGFEILATPVTYAVVIALKRAEGMDVYDYKTNFNPFRVFARDMEGEENVRSVAGAV